jgi:glycosyltransferase involved in cell wall biosynthesis
MDELKVSIITPCHNDGQYLPEAVESATEPVKSGFCEHIIVDDGSDDPHTLQVLAELRERGLTVLSPGKVGLGKARNLGITAASGPYILSLDADNRIHPGYPREAADILDLEYAVGVVYSDKQNFGRNEDVVSVGPFDIDRLLKANYIDSCAVFRKEVWSDTGGFDELEMLWEDWNFWLAVIAADWRFHYIPAVRFYYRLRITEDSLIDRSKNRIAKVRRYIAQKHGYLYRQHFLRLLQEKLKLHSDLEKAEAIFEEKLDGLSEELERLRGQLEALMKK